MTVHVFPTGQPLADVRRVGRGPLRERAARMELWLVAGLIATTVVQAALCVWFWLG